MLIKKDTYITNGQLKRLEALSRKTRVRVARLIRQAIDKYLNEHERGELNSDAGKQRTQTAYH
jgi:predicted DNA-binding protein